MTTLTYHGYTARIEFDGEDEIFVGRIAGIPDVIGFHADTVKGLKKAFHEAVEDYLAARETLGC
ncbi:type II toxin-antitoxin system HicB family antitoxin [Affinirhizobium pseudoryzae]|uniref:type II toxin-antitoxin system HicB family antitoxin n=1 Tax=Allorhizobium pseudoryzae TaxID=379684 RepID=UPI0013EC16CF|nr:type II toxin-antitoxin system HicB family antitoxin [Allorhizobium pseudoryzae]